MRDPNRRPSIRERIADFMIGRYGIDRLYYFLLGICFVLIIINIFINSYIISLIESGLFVYAIFRVISRNVYKRQQENEKFNQIAEKIKKFIKFQKCKWRDNKTHVYKKCPACKNNLRLPREKGEHTVVCPCCKNRFNVKI